MAQIVVAELRPRLQACSIFITVDANFLDQKKMKISIKPSSIVLTWEYCSGVLTQNISLPGCKLIPNSLSCLCVENEFVSFRVQTEPVVGVHGSFSTEILTVSSSRNGTDSRRSESLVASVSPGDVCLFTCHCCGNKLLEKAFRRVLPLPSGTLDSSEWFCHDHGNGSSFSLVPGVEDLFFTSCQFVLNVQSLLSSALSQNFARVARCRRCLAWLGTISSSYVNVWDCTICLDNNSSVVPLQDFVKVVGNAISSCVGLMCRIVVETQLSDTETHYLLLWVIDKDLKILTNLNSNKNLGVREHVGDTVLEPKNTVKLLYLYQSTFSSTVQAWQDDVNVQTIGVAKSMFTEGLEYLRKMTKCIPHSYRVSYNYLTAYLDI